MRRFAILAVLFALEVVAWAAKPVTVDQFERTLASLQDKSDKKAARILSNLVLTQRLGEDNFAHWQPLLPGPESRRELVILADLSQFLPPPMAEIPPFPPPELEKQREILALTVDYAEKTIHQLPNFLATRETIHFEDTPAHALDLAHDPAGTVHPYQALHAVNRTTEHVLYRDGNEVVEPVSARGREAKAKPQGLATWGEFGPILTTVLVDASSGTLVWSRWERSASGPLAVFRFSVPQDKSHYRINLCCTADRTSAFQEYSSYHGELSVDPADGTVHRLVLQADLGPSSLISRADLLVQYGPVVIGGKEYMSPRKSVAVSVSPLSSSGVSNLRIQGPRPSRLDTIFNSSVSGAGSQGGAPQTMLNDVAFEDYQVFRTEMRVLTGKEEPPASPGLLAGNAIAPPSSEPPGGVSSANQPTSAADAKAFEPATPQAPASAAHEPQAATETPAEPPEVAVTDAGPLPESALDQLADRGFSLRVTSRVVDIGVVAADKHGNPITDLKAGDFEIYDEGKRQVVRSFTHVIRSEKAESSPQGPESTAPDPPETFSNNLDDPDQRNAADADKAPRRIIVLIDTNNLAFSDLTFARERLLNFVQHLAPDQQMGLYLQKGRSFQIVVEATSDRTRLVRGIHSWMPNAQQLAQSQEEEARNRQQFDEVLHRDDLTQVNGSANTPGQTEFMQDPQLRTFGANPTQDAFVALVGIARHLAGLPGRTNLVWVASENVLVNWSSATPGSGKGSDARDSWKIRTQEVLNDAHVSLYPVDASQLETLNANSSLANSSVQLSPSVPRGPGDSQHQGGFAGAGLGREAATMQQDVHSIEPDVVHLAEATGGRVFRRGSDLSSTLGAVVRDGDAAYQITFAPLESPDDRYHALTVKVPSHRNAVLSYRTGYLYTKEPTQLADRFREAIWQPLDTHEIALSARRISSFNGGALKLSIAFDDLALKLQGDRWTGKVDIFVVRRSADEMHARISGRTLALSLQPQTYQTMHGREIPMDQLIEKDDQTASFRILAVDENSGRMGSITIPAAALDQAK